MRNEKEMDLAGMVNVKQDSGDSDKVSGKCSRGMPEFRSCVTDSISRCHYVCQMDHELLADDENDAYKAECSNRETYSTKQ